MLIFFIFMGNKSDDGEDSGGKKGADGGDGGGGKYSYQLQVFSKIFPENFIQKLDISSCYPNLD